MNFRSSQWKRLPADEVADYYSALSWLRVAWTTLPVPPARLHTRDIDGQLGQRYSVGFARVLAGLGGWRTIMVQDVCHHPALPHDREGLIGSPFDCLDCQGSGLHLVERDVWDHPMYGALAGLSKVVRRSNGTPSPVEFVMALAWSGWDMNRAATLLGIPIVSDDHRKTVEAQFLMAIRALHSRFSTTRTPTRSESQERAESVA